MPLTKWHGCSHWRGKSARGALQPPPRVFPLRRMGGVPGSAASAVWAALYPVQGPFIWSMERHRTKRADHHQLTRALLLLCRCDAEVTLRSFGCPCDGCRCQSCYQLLRAQGRQRRFGFRLNSGCTHEALLPYPTKIIPRFRDIGLSVDKEIRTQSVNDQVHSRKLFDEGSLCASIYPPNVAFSHLDHTKATLSSSVSTERGII